MRRILLVGIALAVTGCTSPAPEPAHCVVPTAGESTAWVGNESRAITASFDTVNLSVAFDASRGCSYFGDAYSIDPPTGKVRFHNAPRGAFNGAFEFTLPNGTRALFVHAESPTLLLGAGAFRVLARPEPTYVRLEFPPRGALGGPTCDVSLTNRDGRVIDYPRGGVDTGAYLSGSVTARISAGRDGDAARCPDSALVVRFLGAWNRTT
ncbi:MAG: hypothetical protein ACYDCK_07925 [Thermoplasmatota archaeon]